MKPGQGFARRLTKDNLKAFARYLALPGQNSRRDKPGTSGAGEGVDPAATGSESLFGGVPLNVPRKFKSSSGASDVPKPSGPQPTVLEPLGEGPLTLFPPAPSVMAGDVFFAEIPSGSTRWRQANFHKADFTGFFGITKTQKKVKLWHVHDDGSIESAPENRVGGVRKSKNYAIELGAATGKYPSKGRPIGVFHKIGVREFRYMLLMPNSPHHGPAASVLNNHSTSSHGRMKTARMSASNAAAEWPACPLWQVP